MSSVRLPALRGFTLVEVLVAIAIFVVVGLLAMGGYNQLVRQSDHLNESAQRTRAIQSAVHRLAQDFSALEPRPVREPLGEALEPALRADERSEAVVTLTRAGWSNPAGVPRPTLQRVTYQLIDGELIRAYWMSLDRTLAAEPMQAVLLDKVGSINLRFMDQNRGWHTQWPPLGYSGADAARVRPIAVEITLELEDWGEISRLVEVAG